MKNIHVGFLLSYDYELLKKSIPLVYDDADRIFLAKDLACRTWKGSTFSIDPSFFDWLKSFDVQQKIEIFEGDFYRAELTTMQNDTRERTLLSEKMGIGNWLIQVDSDEYFVDFAGFVRQLRKYDHYLDDPAKNKIQIFAWWVIIYKYTSQGILYVDKPMKAVFATNYPNYIGARRTHERIVYVDSLVLHESVARSEEELRYKLDNWSHNVDVNPTFLDKWLQVNETNYKEFTGFYYAEPKRWKTLNYFPTQQLEEIKKYVETNPKLRIASWFIAFKNLEQWVKNFFKRSK